MEFNLLKKIILANSSESDIVLEPEIPGISVGILRRIYSDQDIETIGPHDIVVVEDYPAHVPSLNNPRGIIRTHKIGKNSHSATRARFLGIPNAIIMVSRELLSPLEGKWVYLNVDENSVELRLATNEELLYWEKYVKNIPTPQLGKVNFSLENGVVVNSESFRASEVGHKPSALTKIQKQIPPPMGIRLCQGIAIPFGLQYVLEVHNREIYAKMKELISTIHGENYRSISLQLANLAKEMQYPANLQAELNDELGKYFSENSALYICVSTNAEDLPHCPGYGVDTYTTYSNVPFHRLGEVLKDSQASIWNVKSILENLKLGVDLTQIYAAKYIREAISSDYSFVIHTAHPSRRNRDVLVIELAEGQGESINRCAGQGYIYEYDKKLDTLRLIERGSKTERFVFDSDQGLSLCSVKHSHEFFESRELMAFLRKVSLYACEIENLFGIPQDIEGLIPKERIGLEAVLVQTRVQYGFQLDNPKIEEDLNRQKLAKELIKKVKLKIQETGDYGHVVLMANQFIKGLLNENYGKGSEYFIEICSRWFMFFASLGEFGQHFISAVLYNSPQLHIELQEVFSRFSPYQKGVFLNDAINTYSYFATIPSPFHMGEDVSHLEILEDIYGRFSKIFDYNSNTKKLMLTRLLTDKELESILSQVHSNDAKEIIIRLNEYCYRTKIFINYTNYSLSRFVLSERPGNIAIVLGQLEKESLHYLLDELHAFVNKSIVGRELSNINLNSTVLMPIIRSIIDGNNFSDLGQHPLLSCSWEKNNRKV